MLIAPPLRGSATPAPMYARPVNHICNPPGFSPILICKPSLRTVKIAVSWKYAPTRTGTEVIPTTVRTALDKNVVNNTAQPYTDSIRPVDNNSLPSADRFEPPDCDTAPPVNSPNKRFNEEPLCTEAGGPTTVAESPLLSNTMIGVPGKRAAL